MAHSLVLESLSCSSIANMNMSGYKIFLFFCLCIALTSCNTPNPLPTAPSGTFLFGEEGDEVAADILEMSDGNFLLVGGKENPATGFYDVMVIKVDSEGSEVWTRVFEDERDVYGRFVRRTSDGYVLLVLESTGRGSIIENLFLEYYTDEFEFISSSTVTDPSSYFLRNEDLASFHRTPTGDFLLETNGDKWAMISKISSDGTSGERLEFGNFNTQVKRPSIMTPYWDGGYLVAHIAAIGSRNLFLSFLDSEGNPRGDRWEFDLGSIGRVIGIDCYPDSSCIVFYRENNSPKVLAIRVDSDGNQILQIELDDNANFSKIFAHPDGSLFKFVNENRFFDTNGTALKNISTTSLDGLGITTDVTSYGGTGSDEFRNVIQTTDGRYAIVGFSRSFGAGGSDATLIFHEP